MSKPYELNLIRLNWAYSIYVYVFVQNACTSTQFNTMYIMKLAMYIKQNWPVFKTILLFFFFNVLSPLRGFLSGKLGWNYSKKEIEKKLYNRILVGKIKAIGNQEMSIIGKVVHYWRNLYIMDICKELLYIQYREAYKKWDMCIRKI